VERDRLALFLLAVNSEIAFVDGRMTAAEANVERIFQPILSRSRGDFIRQALIHLHDHYDRLGAELVVEALRSTGNVASHDHIGSRIGFVINDLAKIDAEEARRYILAVWYIGFATAQADGPRFGSKVSRAESDRLDTIVLSMAISLGYTAADVTEWIQEGRG
jgi:hypothetical protein